MDAITEKLKVDKDQGLTGSDYTERKNVFGDNVRGLLQPKPFMKILWETLDDFMLKVLLVAATVSLALAFTEDREDWSHCK